MLIGIDAKSLCNLIYGMFELTSCWPDHIIDKLPPEFGFCGRAIGVAQTSGFFQNLLPGGLPQLPLLGSLQSSFKDLANRDHELM